MDKIKNYGFIEPIIDKDVHWYLGDGSISPQIFMPNGQWDAYLPPNEVQNLNGLETFNCSNYGTNRAVGMLGRKKFGLAFQNNFSERYTGIMTGTKPQGNDPHKVAEYIRLYCGEVPEVFLPFDKSIKTWEQYYGPKFMHYWLFATGRHWLKKYKFNHQWVFLPTDTIEIKKQKMKQALQFSPLGAAGYAWSEHADGLCYSDVPVFNHWFTVYGYEEGKYWKVYDSYDKQNKKLAWDYNFGYAKMYSLDLNKDKAPSAGYIAYAGYYLSTLVGRK